MSVELSIMYVMRSAPAQLAEDATVSDRAAGRCQRSGIGNPS